MPTDATIAPTDGLLVLKECPNCGYSLVGLPHDGVCPECGEDYRQGTAILNCWARGAKATLATAPPRFLVFLAIPAAAGLFVIGSVVANSFRIGRTRWMGVVGVMLVPIIVTLYQIFGRRADRPPIRVRLNAVGCSQTAGPSRPRVDDEPESLVLWRVKHILSLLFIVYVVIAVLWSAPRPTLVGFGAMVAVILLAGWIQSKRQVDRFAHEPPELTIALLPDDGSNDMPTVWREVSRVRLSCGRKGRCRLRIKVGKWWNRAEPIDIEFIAAAEDAAELERRIQSWRTEAMERSSVRSRSESPVA